MVFSLESNVKQLAESDAEADADADADAQWP